MQAQAIALSPWTLEAVADCHRSVSVPPLLKPQFPLGWSNPCGQSWRLLPTATGLFPLLVKPVVVKYFSSSRCGIRAVKLFQGVSPKGSEAVQESTDSGSIPR